MTQPLHIDNSTLSALSKCDTMALLRYGFGWTSEGESAALQCGTAIHTALEVYFKTASVKQAQAAFQTAYEAWSDANIPAAPERHQMYLLRYAYENVADILATWLKRHPLNAEPYKVYPDLVEIGFSFPLADGVLFYGRYDAIVEERNTGMFYVLDHKTTGQITADWAHTFKTSTQITGYTWAAQQLIGKPVAGAIINGIQISKLPDVRFKSNGEAYRCKEHGIGVDECRLTHTKESLAITQRDTQQIEAWKSGAIRLARRWQKLLAKYPTAESVSTAQQQGMFSGACRYCDFRNYCEVNRPADKLAQMLVHNPWAPYEVRAAQKEAGNWDRPKRS